MPTTSAEVILPKLCGVIIDRDVDASRHPPPTFQRPFDSLARAQPARLELFSFASGEDAATWLAEARGGYEPAITLSDSVGIEFLSTYGMAGHYPFLRKVLLSGSASPAQVVAWRQRGVIHEDASKEDPPQVIEECLRREWQIYAASTIADLRHYVQHECRDPLFPSFPVSNEESISPRAVYDEVMRGTERGREIAASWQAVRTARRDDLPRRSLRGRLLTWLHS